MASFILATAERTNLANQIKTDLNGGYLKIYTAAYATLLVTIPLAATSGSVTDGVLTLDCTNTNANAGASGTAAVARFFKSDDSTPVADCDVGTSGATINLQNTSINSGQNVSITSGTITVPAGT
jgi:hypothetical protein